MASGKTHLRQVSGVSDQSVDDAIGRALAAARDTFGEPQWFDVATARGFIRNGRVTHYQVTLDLGYEPLARTQHDGGYFRSACTGDAGSRGRSTLDIRF